MWYKRYDARNELSFREINGEKEGASFQEWGLGSWMVLVAQREEIHREKTEEPVAKGNSS